MPYINNTPQVILNHSLLKKIKDDIDILRQENKELKEDLAKLTCGLDKINEKINYIYTYIVKKKEKEDARWFY
jgi:uncharacterized coiled-coil DUF342 family protein